MYNYNEKELVSRYQKYFDNWDTYAAVRSKPNTYRFEQYHLQTELKNKAWFLPSLIPIFKHPLLKNIDLETEQYMLGRFLLQFLEYGTLMEHEFVNTTLAELALGESGVPLPDRMRIDAFKIYTDEGYHACFNMEATQQIRDYISLPKSEAWPLQNTRLIGLRKLIPEGKTKESFLIRFAITAVSETVATKELAESLKGIVVEPIFNIFMDHAEDEKKHCMYFSTLLEVVWNYLSDDEKKLLGIYFPKIIKAFVAINHMALHDILEKVGFDHESAEVIINESHPADFNVQKALAVGSVTFRIFERLGVFNIPEAKQSFIQEGFSIGAA